MYSKTIKPKVDVMFNDLRNKVPAIIDESSASNEAVKNITKLVSSELSTRSKSIMSDMLFDLSDALMETEFFADVARQNRFSEINLRQEILSKYQFASSASVNYKETSRMCQAAKTGAKAGAIIGGGTFAVETVIDIGAILISGLSSSSCVPISLTTLVISSISAFLGSFCLAGIGSYAVQPTRNKRALAQAVDTYLSEAQQQFLNWFDEVEKYFNMRVEEIKQTL